MLQCPECGHEFSVPEKGEEGEIFECGNCGVEIEIVSLRPLEVKIFEEEEK